MLIAGLGSIGQRHARNLRMLWGSRVELLAYRQRRLRGVISDSLQCDDSRDVEEELGITVFEELSVALAERPAAVFVCTPTSSHVSVAQVAADAGCHLLIEKPLSSGLDGIDRLRRTVARAGLVVLMGCQWRYHPCVKWLRNLLVTGDLGRPVRAAITYDEYLPDWHPYEDYRTSYAAQQNLGGGVVLTQIHDYDLAWSLFGAPRAVTAQGGHLSDLEIDVEDTIDARLDCQVPVFIHQSFASRTTRRLITIDGEAGSVTVNLMSAQITTTSRNVNPPDYTSYQRNQMFLDELRHFDACVRRTEEPTVSLEAGVEVLRIALAVKEAMRTGSAIGVH